VFTFSSYLGGPQFKHHSNLYFSSSYFVVDIGPSRQDKVQLLSLSHDRFLPHTLQFIIHQPH